MFLGQNIKKVITLEMFYYVIQHIKIRKNKQMHCFSHFVWFTKQFSSQERFYQLHWNFV